MDNRNLIEKTNVSLANSESTRDCKKLETKELKTKLTLLLSLTFLFLFGDSVFGEEPEVKREY
jgi:hypothetical protein